MRVGLQANLLRAPGMANKSPSEVSPKTVIGLRARFVKRSVVVAGGLTKRIRFDELNFQRAVRFVTQNSEYKLLKPNVKRNRGAIAKNVDLDSHRLFFA